MKIIGHIDSPYAVDVHKQDGEIFFSLYDKRGLAPANIIGMFTIGELYRIFLTINAVLDPERIFGIVLQ